MSRIFGLVSTRASAAYTPVALESLFRTTPIGVGDRVILIDNDGAGLPSDAFGIEYRQNAEPKSFAENGNDLIRLAARRDDDLFFFNNDVVFTPGWLAPLYNHRDQVMTPTSNQNFTYEAGGLALRTEMSLEDYLGYEEVFLRVIERHQQLYQGRYTSAFKTNFFCVRFTPEVYHRIGLFDQRFTPAGGEDDDYSIRAHLLGSGVLAAEESYVLHFGGRSSWAGPETIDEWHARERNFSETFEKKWGIHLARMFLGRNSAVYQSDPVFNRTLQTKGIPALIRAMLARDSVERPEETLRIAL